MTLDAGSDLSGAEYLQEEVPRQPRRRSQSRPWCGHPRWRLRRRHAADGGGVRSASPAPRRRRLRPLRDRHIPRCNCRWFNRRRSNGDCRTRSHAAAAWRAAEWASRQPSRASTSTDACRLHSSCGVCSSGGLRANSRRRDCARWRGSDHRDLPNDSDASSVDRSRIGRLTSLDLVKQSAAFAAIAVLVVAGAGLLPFFGATIAVAAIGMAVTPTLVGADFVWRPRFIALSGGRYFERRSRSARRGARRPLLQVTGRTDVAIGIGRRHRPIRNFLPDRRHALRPCRIDRDHGASGARRCRR